VLFADLRYVFDFSDTEIELMGQTTKVLKKSAFHMGIGYSIPIGEKAAGTVQNSMAPSAPMAAPPPPVQQNNQAAVQAPPPIQQAEAPPQILYNVMEGGQSTGPFTLEQLGQMARSGRFTRQSMVWRGGMPNWAAAGTVEELASMFPPSAPPPPPVPQNTLSEYYVIINGERTGPHSFDTLRELSQGGHLRRNTLVWKTGMAQWVRADSVSELTPIFGW
jgi:hypothetical protein